MYVYIFQAALLCSDCGETYKREHRHAKPVPDDRDESSFDSDEWPKGPYPNGGGEADSPQHCDHCGLFLENMLTVDGDTYVRDKAKQFETAPDMSWNEIATAAEEGGQPVLGEWIRFYLSWG